MIDRYLRPWKARAYSPLLRPLATVPADAITAVGLVFGLAAAAAAALGRFEWALVAWWANRWLDGLDGELARAAARGGQARETMAPQRGAYLDLMADLLVYAAVPLGLAAGAAGNLTGAPLGDPAWIWAATAVALASFYLNLGSWALLAPALSAAEAAIAAGCPAGAESVVPAPAGHPAATTDPHAPGLRMPAGLMEGAETIVVFSVALAWPAWAATTLATMGALTLVGAWQRTAWGLRRLGRPAA